MSDHYTTQYNHLRRCKEQMEDIFRQAKTWELTHTRILQRLQGLYTTNSYQRLTRYNRSYLEGMRDILHSALYNRLEWRLQYNDEWYNAKTIEKDAPNFTWESANEYFKRMKRRGIITGAHFWIGSNRVFSPEL